MLNTLSIEAELAGMQWIVRAFLTSESFDNSDFVVSEIVPDGAFQTASRSPSDGIRHRRIIGLGFFKIVAD